MQGGGREVRQEDVNGGEREAAVDAQVTVYTHLRSTRPL